MHPYSGCTASLATKHKKEDQIAPALARLGITLEVAAIDTDKLGTFTGEIERIGSPIEVATKKARLGMAATGSSLGLASEGSIGPDTQIPFVNSELEVMVWVDDLRGIEIVESLRSFEIVAIKEELSIDQSIEDLLLKADFPRHSLIARGSDGEIIKGINSRNQLDEVLSGLFQKDDRVIIESDLRAHCSPSRQRAIALLANQLTRRLEALCSSCGTPGFGRIGATYGVECQECGEKNLEKVSGEILGCTLCELREERRIRELIPASDCSWCNP